MPHPSRPDRKSSPAEQGTRGVQAPPGGSPLRKHLLGFSLLIGLSAAAAIIVGTPLRLSTVVYRSGDIAREDVKASRDFLVPDPDATEAKRQEAEAGAPSVYDWDPNALADAVERLRADLAILEVEQAGPEGPLVFDARSVARALGERWEVEVAEQVARLLTVPQERQGLARLLRDSLEPLLAKGVVANRRLLVAEGSRRILVRNLSDRQEKPLEDPMSVADFDETRRQLLEVAGGEPLVALGRKVAGTLLRPNLTFNSEETSARRKAAREEVKPVLYQIRQGEMLVREGDRVTEEQARKLEAHASLALEGGVWRGHLGLWLLALMVIYATYAFGRANVKKFRQSRTDLVFLSALLLVMLGLERIGLFVASGLAEVVPTVGPEVLAFVLPVGAASIVTRVILNSETTVLFALPYYALAAVPYEQKLAAFLCFTVGGLVASHRAARASRRIDFLRAGMWGGVAQAGVVACFALVGSVSLDASALAWVGAALAGGAAGGVVALCLVPLAEGVLGYTTETRLLELASLDHPLLRDLMLRAPGTYHHSIVTGSLVKAAAEAIGARVMLATVAAYYHDIGKISKPAYFIENQVDVQNRHDHLAPSMSSLVLLSHVKEGVELARKHRLGRDIVEIVQQHHGTSLIRYFYDKACSKARQGVEAVNESDYRYPGPKPQSREAALVLLADAVEAASRTVPDPRPSRIQGMVQNIVNRTFTDGQLDECDLTLRNLHDIARSFSRILGAIYHQRIDYPLAAQKEKVADADLDPKRLRDAGTRRGDTAPPDSDRLRRLGM